MSKKCKSLISILLVILIVLSGCSSLSQAPEKESQAPEKESQAPAEEPDTESTGKIVAGTYSAEEQGHGGAVKVSLTVDENGKIVTGEVNATTETDKIGQVAAPTVLDAIISGNSYKVDAVTGATVTSNAIMSAAKKALEHAGIQFEEEQVSKSDDEEINVDVAVVGGGLSGLTAAGGALEKGAKVLLVEKSNNVGGISKFFSGGPFAVESRLQKEAGGEYAEITSGQLIRTLNDYSHFINYAPLTKNIVENSAETIEFLEGLGLSFSVNPESPQLAHRDDDLKWRMYHWFHTFSYEPTDISASDIIRDSLIEKGLDLRLETKATQLIQDDKGNVTGFIAEKSDGSKLTVHAKSVVLGTGGFAGNPEMMKEYFHTSDISMWGEVGSGVNMAWDAGAAKWSVQSSLLHGAGLVNPTNPTEVSLAYSPFSQIVRSPLLWIDRSGNRFGNEEAVYDTAYISNLGYSVGGIFYIVVDADTLYIT